MIIQFLWNSKGPARFFSVPRASKVYHRRFRLFDFCTGHYSLHHATTKLPAEIFVEYDLGESSRSAVDAAPSWVQHPYPAGVNMLGP